MSTRRPSPKSRSAPLLLSAAFVLLAVAVLAGILVERSDPARSDEPRPTPSAISAPRPASGRPNIVLILTDDQRWDQLGSMPTVDSRLVGKGVDFVNGFVVDPLCCPSRTTILTGKYSHSTGIYWNAPPHGGFEDFRHEEGSTVATWLHAGGYRTALVGKYLNGYFPFDTGHVPPGWDVWDAMALSGSGDGEGGYYDYDLSENGRSVHFGTSPGDYSTTVLSGLATRFITSTPRSQPLFLYYAPRAPHGPTTSPPGHVDGCQNVKVPRPPSFDQADVSGMPAYIRAQPRFAASHLRYDFRQSCRALLGVDDSVRAILDALRNTGRLSNTLIVYASDNGLMLGDHRLTGKGVPYEESIRVPVVVRYDPITRRKARVDRHLVLNLDFAQTFAAAAGVPAPGAEGRSLLRLLRNPNAPWRRQFLVEHWEPPPPQGAGAPDASYRPPYCAVRTTRDMYIEYSTGEQELYDIRRDPYELHNLAGRPAYQGLLTRLHTRMVRLCNPPPPGFTP